MAMASRPSAVNAAAQRFDALIEEGRTIGRQFDTGATIVFTPRYPDGFNATLYRNRPSTLPLVATNTPVLVSTAAIVEQETNSVPGFALAIHANGDIAMIPGYHLGATGIAEMACPASHNYQFVLSFAGHSVMRVLPCAAILATTGTPTFAPFPAAPTQTPGLPGTTCTNCTSIPLPSATPSCPAGMIAQSAVVCNVVANPSPSATPVTCPFGGPPPDCADKTRPTDTPNPSAPCQIDKAGLCWYAHTGGVQIVACGNVDGWHTYVPSGNSTFEVYDASSASNPRLFTYSFQYLEPVQEGDDECPTTASWSNSNDGKNNDPSLFYADDPDLLQTINDQLSIDSEGLQIPYCSNEQQCESEWGYN